MRVFSISVARLFFFIFLMVEPSDVLAAGKMTGCQKAKKFKSEIHVTMDIPDIEYDFNKPTEFLTKNRERALEEWKSQQEDKVWSSSDTLAVNGLARGGVGVETRVKLIAKPYDRYGVYYCPYIERLEIRFFYKSTIYVSSDFKKNSCKFKAILDHEMQHHDTNVSAVNAVVKTLKKDARKMVRYLERSYVKKQEIPRKFSHMKASVTDAFKIYSVVIFEEMEKRNSRIDTPAEYERVRALCANKK